MDLLCYENTNNIYFLCHVTVGYLQKAGNHVFFFNSGEERILSHIKKQIMIYNIYKNSNNIHNAYNKHDWKT